MRWLTLCRALPCGPYPNPHLDPFSVGGRHLLVGAGCALEGRGWPHLGHIEADARRTDTVKPTFETSGLVQRPGLRRKLLLALRPNRIDDQLDRPSAGLVFPSPLNRQRPLSHMPDSTCGQNLAALQDLTQDRPTVQTAET